jgi:beta-mannosidase
MEALRFRKNDPLDDCQGALIWSYSDCWGETGWSILDYYLRRKASYYGFRRACRPVKAIVRRRGEHLVTRLVNDTLKPVTATLEYGWRQLDGKQKEIETRTVTAPPNSMLVIGEALIPAEAEKDPRQWIYAVVLSENGLPVDQSIWTLLPHRELSLPTPEIKTRATTDGGLEVSSPVYCHAVHIEDHGREVVSDNWFDLLPGITNHVRLASGFLPEGLDFQAVI